MWLLEEFQQESLSDKMVSQAESGDKERWRNWRKIGQETKECKSKPAHTADSKVMQQRSVLPSSSSNSKWLAKHSVVGRCKCNNKLHFKRKTRSKTLKWALKNQNQAHVTIVANKDIVRRNVAQIKCRAVKWIKSIRLQQDMADSNLKA